MADPSATRRANADKNQDTVMVKRPSEARRRGVRANRVNGKMLPCDLGRIKMDKTPKICIPSMSNRVTAPIFIIVARFKLCDDECIA